MSIRLPAEVTATYQSDGRDNDKKDNCYHATATADADADADADAAAADADR